MLPTSRTFRTTFPQQQVPVDAQSYRIHQNPTHHGAAWSESRIASTRKAPTPRRVSTSRPMLAIPTPRHDATHLPQNLRQNAVPSGRRGAQTPGGICIAAAQNCALFTVTEATGHQDSWDYNMMEQPTLATFRLAWYVVFSPCAVRHPGPLDANHGIRLSHDMSDGRTMTSSSHHASRRRDHKSSPRKQCKHRLL